VAWYASDTPLRSGLAWGQQHLNGTLAAVDVPMGGGHLMLFGPEIAYRGQAHGTFKFLFNAILYANAIDANGAGARGRKSTQAQPAPRDRSRVE
jgi:hypothetical protein